MAYQINPMKSLYESVAARQQSICWHRVTAARVERLGQYLSGQLSNSLLRIYSDLPVSRMEVAFTIRESEAERPVPQETSEYDSERDHIFYWASPTDIVEDIRDGARGELAFRAGFVPIGICAYGGDGYFLSTAPSPPGATPLYQVYYDWISYPELDDPPVPPEAIHLVHPSFESIIAVAEFRRGWMPPEQEDGDLR